MTAPLRKSVRGQILGRHDLDPGGFGAVDLRGDAAHNGACHFGLRLEMPRHGWRGRCGHSSACQYRQPRGRSGVFGMRRDNFGPVRAAAVLRAATNQPFNRNCFIQGAPPKDKTVLQRIRQRVMPWYAALGLGEPPVALPDLAPTFDDARVALRLETTPAVAFNLVGAGTSIGQPHGAKWCCHRRFDGNHQLPGTRSFRHCAAGLIGQGRQASTAHSGRNLRLDGRTEAG